MSRLKLGGAAPSRGVPARQPHKLARRSGASGEPPTANFQSPWDLAIGSGWDLEAWDLGFSYRAGSVPAGGIGCGFKSAFVIPRDHLIASKYICCTSRMSQVVDACANEP